MGLTVLAGARNFVDHDVAQRLALTPHDIAVVPRWLAYTLHATEDLVLFSYSDRVAHEKLGFWREQRLQPPSAVRCGV